MTLFESDIAQERVAVALLHMHEAAGETDALLQRTLEWEVGCACHLLRRGMFWSVGIWA